MIIEVEPIEQSFDKSSKLVKLLSKEIERNNNLKNPKDLTITDFSQIIKRLNKLSGNNYEI